MKVVFFGNHTVGIKALSAISETEEIVGVIAHPQDPEDGVRYSSVYEFAIQHNWKVIRSTGRNSKLEKFIKETQPDLLWITDYRYIVPSSLISLAPLGAVNLHPSLLPKYRGRAPVNWAILNGEHELGLTAHFVDEGMDTGDIIEQIAFLITEKQNIGDILEILYPLYENITQVVLNYFHTGHIPRYPQEHSRATIFPRRRPEDGLIDWTQSNRSIHNLIRAITHPYPGAFTFWKGTKIMIWSSTLLPSKTAAGVPGEVISSNPNNFFVCTGLGTICINSAEIACTGEPIILKNGEILELA